MNSLVNPTGRKEHFRGVDWVIEHNNLYIKRIFGGSGSNHTVNQMIEASPLIEVYKDIRQQFEDMFNLTHKTSRHSPPNMKLTFQKLREYMEKYNSNDFIRGRDATQNLVNTMGIGIAKLTRAVEDARTQWMAKHDKQEQLRAEAESGHIPRADTEMETSQEHEPETEFESQAQPSNDEDEDIDPLDEDGSGLFVDD